MIIANLYMLEMIMDDLKRHDPEGSIHASGTDTLYVEFYSGDGARLGEQVYRDVEGLDEPKTIRGRF